jgi:hypothetical protein
VLVETCHQPKQARASGFGRQVANLVLSVVAVRCLRLGPGRAYPPTPVPGTKIPFACFRALGQSGSAASLRALVQLGQATTNRRLLQEPGKALAKASVLRGMSATRV